ncbi:Gfo/Idh/MocA family protein [Lapidilactobacillus wuchangensis]|uniref:Gfo/Idh/MocA family protein n=1 Tax=Lapidilactobacillus wuchangensis TaxID=2486001 RepID=UPI000F772F06|nr:Gfo/Idh/MocA family oxidoreductase [Lapidilactobacillus wuchangensis]
MLKIGVVGLGNIAQKAYLPVMAAMQDQVEWILCTRNSDKLAQLKKQYGFQQSASSVTELLAQQPNAVFLHTPTATHGTLIRQFLLAGVHVYVDKPVSTDLAEVAALYQLAAERHLLLTCGFNRRFAPLNQRLVQATPPNVIVAQKNRLATEQPVAFAIFDLLIHVVDTGLYLAGPLDLTTAKRHFTLTTNANGMLAFCGITLTTADQTIYLLMNMDAGVNREITQVQRPTGMAEVIDLSQLQSASAAGVTTVQLPDWTPTLTQRGFAPLIKAFVQAVADQHPTNPVSATSSIAAHQLCTELLQWWQNPAK